MFLLLLLFLTIENLAQKIRELCKEFKAEHSNEFCHYIKIEKAKLQVHYIILQSYLLPISKIGT